MTSKKMLIKCFSNKKTPKYYLRGYEDFKKCLGNEEKIKKNLLKFETYRLKTFKDKTWSQNYFSIQELAKNGFFYYKNDLVKCAFCFGVVSACQSGETLICKHFRSFPKCIIFKKQIETLYNVNLKSSVNKISNSTNNNSYNLGIIIDIRPYHISLRLESARKKTFNINIWKTLNTLNIDDLVDAGFFSCGVSDYVRCFFCNGFLYDWKNEDIPWKEHLKYFPDCKFLQLNLSNSSYLGNVKSLDLIKNELNYKTCKLCFFNEIGVVFLPCGHQFCCTKCAFCIYKCSLCKKVIKGFVKTYLS